MPHTGAQNRSPGSTVLSHFWKYNCRITFRKGGRSESTFSLRRPQPHPRPLVGQSSIPVSCGSNLWARTNLTLSRINLKTSQLFRFMQVLCRSCSSPRFKRVDSGSSQISRWFKTTLNSVSVFLQALESQTKSLQYAFKIQSHAT